VLLNRAEFTRRGVKLTFVLGFLLAASAGCMPPPSETPTVSPGPAASPTATTATVSPSPTSTSEPQARNGLVIGVEYVLLDSPQLIARQASLFGEAGFRAGKPIAEAHSWGEMQSSATAPINFSKLDNFVREFQAAGFTEATLALKSHSTWASVDHKLLKSVNAAPKPEYRDEYAEWVRAVVERYDADGLDDMPGLRYPVRHYEIGSEFSTYEPEPVAEYLAMLELAYRAAHEAFPDVSIAHAAILATDFFIGDPPPEQWAARFDAPRYGPHGLAEIRAILDRPDIFDVLNVHALAHPGEIEQLVEWLEWETGQRGYSKPIIISDTSNNPFISWGPATACDRSPQLTGLVIWPAVEADRCRLADYFSRVLGGDAETVAWMRRFIAADMVKKVVIAAEQGVTLINTAFTTDLPLLDSPIGQAGAGNAGWGGMITPNGNTKYPNYYAMKQLLGHLQGYTEIKRLNAAGPEGTRVYEVVDAEGRRFWVGWYDPPRLVLHGDPEPQTVVTLETGPGQVTVEAMTGAMGQSEPEQAVVEAGPGGVEVTLGPDPLYVWAN
jgi:hypothetical protein